MTGQQVSVPSHLKVDSGSMETPNSKTTLCALLGDPVEHSFSPLIHNAAFRERKLNFVYLAFAVKDLHSALKGVRALGIRGLSITIPHKVRALEFVDRLDPLAEKIGSLNTIVNDQGVLTGYNSDGMGALKALRERGVETKGKRVVVLGSGGASRALAFSLLEDTPLKSLTIFGVLENELACLVRDLRSLSRVPVEGFLVTEERLRYVLSRADLLVNCSPVGMYPKVMETPVPPPLLHPRLAVFDVVYNPPRTTLLQDAEAAGCTTISGIEMFINQAVVQFELWTGEKAPEALMRKVLLEHLSGA